MYFNDNELAYRHDALHFQLIASGGAKLVFWR